MFLYAIIAYLIAAPIGVVFFLAACFVAKRADERTERFYMETCRGCGKFTCNCLPAE